MAVVTAEIVLQTREQPGETALGEGGEEGPGRGGAGRGPTRSLPPTIRCLYSSEASCTATSHALGPLAYTWAGSNFQNLREKGMFWDWPRPFGAFQLYECSLWGAKAVG